MWHSAARQAGYACAAPPETSAGSTARSGPGSRAQSRVEANCQKMAGGKKCDFYTQILRRVTGHKSPGMLHDRVVHKKTRVKVGNKFRWVAPKYVEVQKHRLPGGKSHAGEVRYADRRPMLAFFKRTRDLEPAGMRRGSHALHAIEIGPVRVLESRKRPVDMHRRTCTVVSGVDYRVRACDGQKKDASSLRYIVGATAVCRGLRQTVGKCHSLPQYNVMPQQLHPFESTLPKVSST